MSVTVTDSVGILTPQARADLEATVAPFRVKAIFESTTKPVLHQHVASCVDSPTTVCIGVDPVHHFTWTEIGIDTGIKSADYQQVARAGNADFHDGHWAQGVQDIVSRGAVLAQQKVSATPVIIQQPQTVVDHGVSPWPFILGFGGLLVVGYIAYRILRKQHLVTEDTIKGLQEERFEYASRNVDAMAKEAQWTDKMAKLEEKVPFPGGLNREPRTKKETVVAPEPPAVTTRVIIREPAAPAPVVIRDSGASFTDGLVLGSVLNRSAPEPYYRERTPPPVHHHRERTPEPVRYDSDSGSGSSFSSDSGGGSGGDFGGGGDFSGGGGGGDF